jgi:hypothetical protein
VGIALRPYWNWGTGDLISRRALPIVRRMHRRLRRKRPACSAWYCRGSDIPYSSPMRGESRTHLLRLPCRRNKLRRATTERHARAIVSSFSTPFSRNPSPFQPHLRTVSAVQPSFPPIEHMADHCEPCSLSWSKPFVRTARARTSGESLLDRPITPSQGLEPPANPERFMRVTCERWRTPASASVWPRAPGFLRRNEPARPLHHRPRPLSSCSRTPATLRAPPTMGADPHRTRKRSLSNMLEPSARVEQRAKAMKPTILVLDFC